MKESGRADIGSVEYVSNAEDKNHSEEGKELAEHSKAAYDLFGDKLADVDGGHDIADAWKSALHYSKDHKGPYVMNVDKASHYKSNQVDQQICGCFVCCFKCSGLL